MTPMTPTTPTALPDLQHRITIEASVDRVWTAVTDPDHVADWLGCLQFRAAAGHLFYMQPDAAKRAAGDTDGATHCEVLEITPPTRLAFSWFLPGTPKTTVTLTLAARDTGITEVTLSHAGWDQFDRTQVQAIHEQLQHGWRDFVLPGLRRVVIGTRTPPAGPADAG